MRGNQFNPTGVLSSILSGKSAAVSVLATLSSEEIKRLMGIEFNDTTFTSWAISQSNFKDIQKILRGMGIDILNQVVVGGCPPATYFLQRKLVADFFTISELGANIMKPCPDGTHPVLYAITSSRDVNILRNVFRLFVSKGLNINKQIGRGATPLMHAARSEANAVNAMLLEGADPLVVVAGQSALTVAIEAGNKGGIKYLIGSILAAAKDKKEVYPALNFAYSALGRISRVRKITEKNRTLGKTEINSLIKTLQSMQDN